MPANRVVALPRLRGRAPMGVPQDADGFIPVDPYGLVQELPDVYAAGDVTASSISRAGSPPSRPTPSHQRSPRASGHPWSQMNSGPCSAGCCSQETVQGACAPKLPVVRVSAPKSARKCSGFRRGRSPGGTCRLISPGKRTRSSPNRRSRQPQSRSTSSSSLIARAGVGKGGPLAGWGSARRAGAGSTRHRGHYTRSAMRSASSSSTSRRHAARRGPRQPSALAAPARGGEGG